MRLYWTAVAAVLFQAAVWASDSSGLAYFDPEAAGTLQAEVPRGTVKVNVDFRRPTIKIGERFYGVNSHPLPAEEAFRNPELVRDLAPDSIRIMALKRTFWYRENGVSKTRIIELSPARGVFNWKSLDDLVEAIESFGAEPYVALGFGAPKWLNSAGGKRFWRPARQEIPELAEFMTDIAVHLREKNFKVEYITIDNEPENVGYPIADYVMLEKEVAARVGKLLPGLKIAGPVTGYASWKQPDGRSLSFAGSLALLKKDGVRFNAVDWHIYATNPSQVFKTIDIIRRVYPDTPLFLSEYNLDWRYTGKGGERSRQNNTSWNSVRTLAAVFDGLQRRGVERVYYFCLRNNFFGLYDYNLTETRPAYHLFRLFTRGLGRERMQAVSSHPAVGAIATAGNGGKALLLYNLCDRAVPVTVGGWRGAATLQTLSREWYEANKAIRNGRAAEPPVRRVDPARLLTVPAGGVLLLKSGE